MIGEGQPGLLTIGEFSRRSRLPASTLRYYHQRGLLEPAYVDPATGYRYYSPSQLAAASLVNELRRVGVRPGVIERLTTGEADVAAVIAPERRRLEAEMRQRAQALATLDRLVDGLSAGTSHTVTVADRERRVVPSMCGEVRCGSGALDVQRLMVRLRRHLRDLGLRDPGWYGAVLPLDVRTDPLPATLFAPVDIPITRSVPTTVLPAAGYATTEHAGDLVFAPAYGALLDWIDANGFRAQGPVIEEYLGDRREPCTRISIGLAP